MGAWRHDGDGAMNHPAPLLLVADSLLGAEIADVDLVGDRDGVDVTLLVLRERIRAWEAKFVKAKAAATVKAVRSDWLTFKEWCDRTDVRSVPVSTKDLLTFLRDMVVLGRRRSSLERYIYSIREIHKAARVADPTVHLDWELDWQGLVRDLVAAGTGTPEQAEPLQTLHVQQILATLGDAPRDLRDAALLSLAADTLCRESELACVRPEDFKPKADGSAWTLFVGRTKVDQDGVGAYRFVSLETKARVDRWCATLPPKSTFVFLPVGGRPKNQPEKTNSPPPPEHLRPQEIARIFRRRAVQAGLAAGHAISGHSARVGSAIDLVEDGAPLSDVAYAGGWQSDRMVRRYAKRAQAGTNAMSKLRAKQRP
jgi:site-specific recombinase XerD